RSQTTGARRAESRPRRRKRHRRDVESESTSGLNLRQALDANRYVAIITRVRLQLERDGQRAGILALLLERIGKIVQQAMPIFSSRCGHLCRLFEPLDGLTIQSAIAKNPRQQQRRRKPQAWRMRRRRERRNTTVDVP